MKNRDALNTAANSPRGRINRDCSAAGFTLVELLIVVVIVGILAAIGYPSYREQAIRSARSDARTELIDAMARQEQFFLNNRTYSDTLAGLDLSPMSDNGYYEISIDAASAGCAITSCYAMRATPQGGQTADTDCNVLTINSSGVKSASGANPSTCW